MRVRLAQSPRSAPPPAPPARPAAPPADPEPGRPDAASASARVSANRSIIALSSTPRPTVHRGDSRRPVRSGHPDDQPAFVVGRRRRAGWCRRATRPSVPGGAGPRQQSVPRREAQIADRVPGSALTAPVRHSVNAGQTICCVERSSSSLRGSRLGSSRRADDGSLANPAPQRDRSPLSAISPSVSSSLPSHTISSELTVCSIAECARS